jgi:hypothetical protein
MAEPQLEEGTAIDAEMNLMSLLGITGTSD